MNCFQYGYITLLKTVFTSLDVSCIANNKK